MILLWHIPSKLFIFIGFWYIMQWINPIKLINFIFHELSSKSRFITCGYAENWESRWHIFVIYISGLFNDNICSSDWTASSDWMILSNESEGMWKEVVVAWSETLVRDVCGWDWDKPRQTSGWSGSRPTFEPSTSPNASQKCFATWANIRGSLC